MQVEYEELPVIGTVEAALAADAVPVHENTRDNVLFRATLKTEGFEAAFAGAHLVVNDTFYSPRLAALSLEPRGCLAIYDNGLESLTFYTSTQIPHIVRTALAEALDWDETRLRVIAPDVGGGFGMKAYLYPEELIAAYLARELDTPIKWASDRREDLLSSVQGRGYRFDVALGLQGRRRTDRHPRRYLLRYRRLPGLSVRRGNERRRRRDLFARRLSDAALRL